ncbi:MAG: quinolinate synthase NadA [Candidatus Krumholzibacteriota bacterium]|nr:quinolinate synthase NadA [Candidatus Krumholzibacteriota bacterium]
MRENPAGPIARLKKERGAVILAHNYQPPAIQDIADHLGDSLDLSRTAASLPDPVIVFCGVHFMAETASILAPGKTVLLPEPSAGCPMADMIDADDLAGLKRKHPDAAVVMYVNSTAEVKALTDCCCTSANAEAVVASIEPGRPIIFGPDCHLGRWVAARTGREMILWDGYCPTHQRFSVERVRELRRAHPGARLLVHPEADDAIVAEADAVLGTGGMIRYAAESDAGTFVIGTEAGMCYRLETLFPGKTFIPLSPSALCANMKKITPEKILASLESLSPRIVVPPAIAAKAERAIRRMIAIG